MKTSAVAAVVVATVATLSFSPRLAQASGVVGAGTAVSCTEAAFDAAVGGGGNVTFNCGRSPVFITITSQKVISIDTSIDGGALITLQGSGPFVVGTGVFAVRSGAALAIVNLTISNGSLAITDGYGGAIYNAGTLTVTNSTFSGNNAPGGGAIFNLGTLNVTNSTFSGNNAIIGDGGAIFNEFGTLNVTNSTFSGNNAQNGGAIASIAVLAAPRLRELCAKSTLQVLGLDIVAVRDPFIEELESRLLYLSSWLVELLGAYFLAINSVVTARYNLDRTNDVGRMRMPRGVTSDAIRGLYGSTLVFKNYHPDRIRAHIPTVPDLMKERYCEEPGRRGDGAGAIGRRG